MKDITIINKKYCVAALSDTGRVREINEDYFGWHRNQGILLLADGMGGYQHGDIASQTAINRFIEKLDIMNTPTKKTFLGSLKQLFNCHNPAPDQQQIMFARQLVEDILYDTHIEIQQINRESEDGSVMGTTVAGVWLSPQTPNQLLTFHVGDSRVYQFSEGILKQLTKDHSLLQDWYDNGQCGDMPGNNIILQAMGLDAQFSPTINVYPITDNDKLLLCSDGLSNKVNDLTISEILAELRQENIAESCQQLIDLANKNGGDDNITAILLCPCQ